MSSTQRQSDTRERILAAAATIVAEDGVAARLSVRTVAGRAGVSIGSLRHHFPTQQALRDEVIDRIIGWLVPGGEVELEADDAVPAEERLLRRLRAVLNLSGTGQAARDAMIAATDAFVVAPHTTDVRDAYFAAEHHSQRRMEEWLDVIAGQGRVPRGDIARQSRFLASVLKGLAWQRACPPIDGLAHVEEETLRLAVKAVTGTWPERS